MGTLFSHSSWMIVSIHDGLRDRVIFFIHGIVSILVFSIAVTKRVSLGSA